MTAVPRPRRPLATTASLAVFLLALLCVASVQAHAEARDSSPGPGQRLDVAPSEVVVHFTEPVYEQGSWLQVRNLDGARVDLDDLTIEHGDKPVMRIGLPDDLPDGAYLIVWQTYSQSDGHTVGNSIGFAVGGFEPPATTSGQGIQVLPAIARALGYAGYALAFGALAFRLQVGRRTRGLLRPADAVILDRALLAGAALLTLGSGMLLLDTARQTGLALGDYLASDGGRALLRRVVFAAATLVLTFAWTARRMRGPLTTAILGGLWGASAWLGAEFGHASVHGTWAVMVQWVHVLSVSTWVGGLALFFLFLALRRGDDAFRLGQVFGGLAFWSVVGMAVTGVILSVAILQGDLFHLASWGGSDWGGFLLAKIGIASVMVALAGVNRFLFLADGADRPGPGRALRGLLWRRKGWQPLLQNGRVRDLRRMVAYEAGFGVVVLVLAGFLMSLAAPQPGLPDPAGFSAGAQGNVFLGQFEIRPEPLAGEFHEVRVFVQDEATGGPSLNNTCGRDDCLRLSWWPDADGERMAQEAVGVPEGDGWWRFDDVLFASAGDHTMRLEVQTAEVFFDALEVAVPVASA